MFQTLFLVAIVVLAWHFLREEGKASRVREAKLEREELRQAECARKQESARRREQSRLAEIRARGPEILSEARLGRMHARQLQQVLDNQYLYGFSAQDVELLESRWATALRTPECATCHKLQPNCICGRAWIMEPNPKPRGSGLRPTPRPRGIETPSAPGRVRPATCATAATETHSRPIAPPPAVTDWSRPTPKLEIGAAVQRGAGERPAPQDLSSRKPRLMALLRNGQLSKHDAAQVVRNRDCYRLSATELVDFQDYMSASGKVLPPQKFCGSCLMPMSICMCGRS